MGIFDASFQTSVQAVNKMLLEPLKAPDGKLSRFRTALMRGPRTQSNSPATTPTKQDTTKRTKRKSPISAGTQRPQIGSPQEHIDKSAVKAAMKAMEAEDGLHEDFAHHHGNHAYEPSPGHRNKGQAFREANEGRRVSNKMEPGSSQKASASHELATMPLSTRLSGGDDEKPSVLGRMSWLIRRPHFRSTYLDDHPLLFGYAQGLLLGLKRMILVVLDTTALIISVVFEYKREGLFVIPKGTSSSELLGNCLRSILYLMIVACIYAMVVKVLRTVLVVVRILLLPVRICAWIIG